MNLADAAITYGENGIRCGCGKPAHSNLAACDGPEAWRPNGGHAELCAYVAGISSRCTCKETAK